MSSEQRALVDLTLTSSTAIVHAVADHLAGRWVDLVWGSSDGVWHGPAIVLGCCALDDDVGVVLRVELPTDDGEPVEVSLYWDEILDVGRRVRADALPVVKRAITASRWFGRRVEIVQHDGSTVVGVVVGFDLGSVDVDVILDMPLAAITPLDGPCYAEYAVAFDSIARVIDRPT